MERNSQASVRAIAWLAGLALTIGGSALAQDRGRKPAQIMPRGTSHIQPRTTPSVTPKTTPSVTPRTTPSISPKTTPSIGYKTTPSISPRRPGDSRVPPITPPTRPPSNGNGNGHGHGGHGHDHDGNHQWTREELRRYLLHRRYHDRVILVPSGTWWGIDGYYSNGSYYGYGAGYAWPPVDSSNPQEWVDWYNRSGYAWDYRGQWADPVGGWQPEYVYANGEPPADESLRPAGRVREEIRRGQVQREMDRLGWKDGKPPAPPTPYESAIIAFRDGKPANAIPFLREHLKTNAEDAEAMRLLALAQISGGKAPDGVAMMRAAYMLDPTLATRKLAYTDLCFSSSAFRDTFTRAMSYANNAKSGSAYLSVAVLAQAEGRDAIVQQMVEKAVKSGLQREISDAMFASLTPTAKPANATPAAQGAAGPQSETAPAAGSGSVPVPAASPANPATPTPATPASQRVPGAYRESPSASGDRSV